MKDFILDYIASSLLVDSIIRLLILMLPEITRNAVISYLNSHIPFFRFIEQFLILIVFYKLNK